MGETIKSWQLSGDLERSVLAGNGIDMGCGTDPVEPDVRRIDTEHGYASETTRFVREQYDFVYSSHCLEHRRDPGKTLGEWWKRVKARGRRFFLVSDEDLYVQGNFPGQFNPEPKTTFARAKSKCWSPVSDELPVRKSYTTGSTF